MPAARSLAVAALGIAAVTGCAGVVPIAGPTAAEVSLAFEGGIDAGTLERGHELYTTRCTRCHHARPVDRYAPERWNELLPRMIEQTRLEETDALALRTFLAVRMEVGGNTGTGTR